MYALREQGIRNKTIYVIGSFIRLAGSLGKKENVENITDSLPYDAVQAIYDCRIRLLTSRTRVEPQGSITIYRNPHTNKLEYLNSTGTIIITMSTSGHTIGEIIEYLVKAFGLAGSEARFIVSRDVMMFVRALQRKGVAEVLWGKRLE